MSNRHTLRNNHTAAQPRLLLDACVLYPTVMREVLLAVARKGLFQPLWSARILEEWARAARKIAPDGETIARGEIALLRAAWPDAEVARDEALEAQLWLPDPSDVHVLAAAITARADLLVTLNLRDFPRGAVEEHGVKTLAPDAFLMALLPLHSAAIEAAVAEVHATAERLSGAAIPPRKLLKKARLPRLGKALEHLGTA